MILIVSKPGQLGNMLCIYSHLIARAIESDLKVGITAFNDYSALFPTTNKDLFCRFPPRECRFHSTPFRRKLIYNLVHFAARVLSKLPLRLPRVRLITLRDWHTEFNLGDPEFLQSLRPRELVLLRGWLFRDSESLSKHAQNVREFFRPHDRQVQNVEALIEKARKGVDILVGVHIRHGIVTFANARQYFYTTNRYTEMMDEIVALFPNKQIGFLICSDWAQDQEQFSRFRATFGTHDMIEDLYALAECDYIVGPPSTFTQWASFYGKVPLNVISAVDQRQAIEDFRVRLPYA